MDLYILTGLTSSVFLSVKTKNKNTVVYQPIYNGTTFWHGRYGPIILDPCFWLFSFGGSKAATARTKSNNTYDIIIRKKESLSEKE